MVCDPDDKSRSLTNLHRGHVISSEPLKQDSDAASVTIQLPPDHPAPTRNHKTGPQKYLLHPVDHHVHVGLPEGRHRSAVGGTYPLLQAIN